MGLDGLNFCNPASRYGRKLKGWTNLATTKVDALPDPTADVVRWNDAGEKQALHQGVSLEFRLEYKLNDSAFGVLISTGGFNVTLNSNSAALPLR